MKILNTKQIPKSVAHFGGSIVIGTCGVCEKRAIIAKIGPHIVDEKIVCNVCERCDGAIISTPTICDKICLDCVICGR